MLWETVGWIFPAHELFSCRIQLFLKIPIISIHIHIAQWMRSLLSTLLMIHIELTLLLFILLLIFLLFLADVLINIQYPDRPPLFSPFFHTMFNIPFSIDTMIMIVQSILFIDSIHLFFTSFIMGLILYFPSAQIFPAFIILLLLFLVVIMACTLFSPIKQSLSLLLDAFVSIFAQVCYSRTVWPFLHFQPVSAIHAIAIQSGIHVQLSRKYSLLLHVLFHTFLFNASSIINVLNVAIELKLTTSLCLTIIFIKRRLLKLLLLLLDVLQFGSVFLKLIESLIDVFLLIYQYLAISLHSL